MLDENAKSIYKNAFKKIIDFTENRSVNYDQILIVFHIIKKI